jgi:hypothetical protein
MIDTKRITIDCERNCVHAEVCAGKNAMKAFKSYLNDLPAHQSIDEEYIKYPFLIECKHYIPAKNNLR